MRCSNGLGWIARPRGRRFRPDDGGVQRTKKTCVRIACQSALRRAYRESGRRRLAPWYRKTGQSKAAQRRRLHLRIAPQYPRDFLVDACDKSPLRQVVFGIVRTCAWARFPTYWRPGRRFGSTFSSGNQERFPCSVDASWLPPIIDRRPELAIAANRGRKKTYGSKTSARLLAGSILTIRSGDDVRHRRTLRPAPA
jgi:hypothetical protein